MRPALSLIASILLGTTLMAADITGTWKLNVAKSRLCNPVQSYVMKIQKTAPMTYRCSFDIVGANGEKRHNEIIRIADGKEHAMLGVNLRPGASEIVSEDNLKVIRKRDGKVVLEMNIKFSPDGKSHEVATTGVDANGKSFTELNVFERP